MDWTQSKLGYYADFAIVPLLIIAAIALAPAQWLWIPAGLATWTFAEYLIHRVVLHHVVRDAHWLHHERPHRYIATPWFLTLSLHAVLFGTALVLPDGFLGAYAGLELGYLTYSIVHERMHHGARPSRGFLARRRALHDLHHAGLEVNFGVTTSLWDHVFRTHCNRLEGERLIADRRRLRTATRQQEHQP